MNFLWQSALLLLSVFTSGIILFPGTSEIALAAYIKYYPQLWVISLIICFIGSFLGLSISYLLGRIITEKFKPSEKSKELINKYGYYALFLSWVPLLGDPLVIAAGWSRMNFLLSIFCLSIGKLIRYIFVLYSMLVVFK